MWSLNTTLVIVFLGDNWVNCFPRIFGIPLQWSETFSLKFLVTSSLLYVCFCSYLCGLFGSLLIFSFTSHCFIVPQNFFHHKKMVWTSQFFPVNKVKFDSSHQEYILLVSLIHLSEPIVRLDQFSSFIRLIRVIAWCQWFANIFLAKNDRGGMLFLSSSTLTTIELQFAKKLPLFFPTVLF